MSRALAWTARSMRVLLAAPCMTVAYLLPVPFVLALILLYTLYTFVATGSFRGASWAVSWWRRELGEGIQESARWVWHGDTDDD